MRISGGTERGRGIQSNTREYEVFVKLTASDGRSRIVNGYYTDAGVPVTATALDPDAEFPYEYGRPEFNLSLVTADGCGPLIEIEAWVNKPKSGTVLFRQRFTKPVIPDAGQLRVTGPAYGE